MNDLNVAIDTIERELGCVLIQIFWEAWERVDERVKDMIDYPSCWIDPEEEAEDLEASKTFRDEIYTSIVKMQEAKLKS